ncbi:cyclase family protein [Planifilum fimeticola]
MLFENCRLIDLSLPIEHEAVSEPMPARIRYITHDGEGLEQMKQLFGVQQEDLVWSGGLGWALEEITAITHTGTHVDAPYHYHPTSGGRPARRIDELPLEWFLAPAVRLDVRHIEAGRRIRVSDLEEALARIDYRLRPGDVVLLMTGRDRFCHSPEYYRQPGLGREEVLWLVDQGVRVIGIDAYTLDRPFADMVADYKKTGDGRHIWPAHFAGIEAEYCQIEKLANLDRIPVDHGFWISCFPVKIAGASGAWCRAVAIVPEQTEGGRST